MRLLTWPHGAVEETGLKSLPPDLANRKAYWLDLDSRTDDIELCLETILGPNAFRPERHEMGGRPRVVEGEEYLYVFLHEVRYDQEHEIRVTEAHFYLGRGFLLSIHAEIPGGLEQVWVQRPKELSPTGLDNLFAEITDDIVERAFPVLDRIAEAIEATEDTVFPRLDASLQSKIFDLRKDLLNLRRTIGPMREVFAQLLRLTGRIFDRRAQRLLGEVHEHLVQLYELVDLQRDLLGNLTEVYLSTLSNRMNEIMKTLTIIATIMMPLSVIVGIYGMNFRHLPELRWRLGYPMVWGLMILVSGGMLIYFRRRRWF